MSERDFEKRLLDRAFERGYMNGKMGMDLRNCPYKAQSVQVAWQLGWKDGRADARFSSMPRSTDA
jgi:ribosome modulation factor